MDATDAGNVRYDHQLSDACNDSNFQQTHLSRLRPQRIKYSCESGGIGRRAGFRFQYRKVCRFDSCHPHLMLRQTVALCGELRGNPRSMSPDSTGFRTWLQFTAICRAAFLLGADFKRPRLGPNAAATFSLFQTPPFAPKSLLAMHTRPSPSVAPPAASELRTSNRRQARSRR